MRHTTQHTQQGGHPAVQDLSLAQRALTVGVLGAGTIGSQVIRLLTEQADNFAARPGARLEITGVAVRDVSAPCDLAVPQDLLTDDATVIVTGNDPIIELIGGTEPAHIFIPTAFKAGASVVTGNKVLIVAHSLKLYITAAATGTDFYYEVAAADAIPMVYTLCEPMTGDRVTNVLGIVDGATNYVLDEVSTKGPSFEAALVTVQGLGYTEADFTADVGGLDAAAKAAIITSLVSHTHVSLGDVPVEDIREVTVDDARETRASGRKLKLLVIAQRRDDEHAQDVSVRVHPALASNDHPLTSVHGAYNAVLVEAKSAERLMFYGQGAGGAPITSAVLSDVVAAATHRIHDGQIPHKSSYASLRVLGPEAAVTRYQIQLRSDDTVGSLVAIASVFAENEVSTNLMHQSAYVTSDDSRNQAAVTFMAHSAPVFHLDTTVEDLRNSNRVAEAISIQRVEGE